MATCKLCGSLNLIVNVKKDAKNHTDLSIAFCQQCSMVQQKDIPDDNALKVYYSHNYRQDYKSTYKPKLKYVYRAGRAALNRLTFLQECVQPASHLRLLNIGADGGEFVYMAQKAGFTSRGIEPSIGYSEYARDEYGISVETGMLDD